MLVCVKFARYSFSRIDQHIGSVHRHQHLSNSIVSLMDNPVKREHGGETTNESEEPPVKIIKADTETMPSLATEITPLQQSRRRLIPQQILKKLTPEDIDLLTNVQTNCTDLDRIRKAIELRMKHRICPRLPEAKDDSDYYIQDGLRKVYPYPFLFQTFAKHRWQNRKLITIIKDEFRDLSIEALKLRFDMKRVLINGVPVSHDHILRNNQFICNLTHRHELPVLAAPIKVLYRDKDTLVVNKPPSMPIHPCGRFRHNSVLNIMERQYGFDDIRIVHRLDRLVSGVLMMAFNSRRAHELETQMVERSVQKVYVCRVTGEFPLGDPDNDGEILVDQPLHSLEGKIGVSVVMEGGKPSQTAFKRLSYNGKTSAVMCKPKTGRTHQIRVHLQYLGHPIVNDLLYNCSSFGPEKGKGARFGKSYERLSADILTKHKASTWLAGEHNDVLDPNLNLPPTNEGIDPESDFFKTAKFISDDEKKETMASLESFYTEEILKELEDKYKFQPDRLTRHPECRDCVENYHDPPLRSLYLYLHALKYSGPGWSYESDMPTWALDSWKY